MRTFDLIVIGSGGGTKITSAALKLGKKVALIEKDKAGGTCLNRGCIPSKMLIHPAHVFSNFKTLDRFKIAAEVKHLDYEALIASINAYTDETSDGISAVYDQAENATYIRGQARFVDDKTVEVNGEKFTAEKMIIATGSRPKFPLDIPGLSNTPYMTSNEALRNKHLPKRIIVLGGGYIAAELGGAFASFGSDVTFVVRSSMLRHVDREVRAEFYRLFSAGKRILEETKVLQMEYSGKHFYLEVEGPGGREKLVSDELLLAAGITPNSDQLGLENTRIQVNARGYIVVDEYLQTGVPGVYAIGDVAGNHLFRHSVNFEGEYWVEANYLKPKPSPIKYPPMPGAVFTHPEIASVGLTQESAKKIGTAVIIGKAGYTSCAMAKARALDSGLVKLLFDAESHVLLGAHIVGEEASTMIQELVLAATSRLTAEQMYKQIYIHPAFPEVVRNALRDALQQMDEKYKIIF